MILADPFSEGGTVGASIQFYLIADRAYHLFMIGMIIPSETLLCLPQCIPIIFYSFLFLIVFFLSFIFITLRLVARNISYIQISLQASQLVPFSAELRISCGFTIKGSNFRLLLTSHVQKSLFFGVADG